LTGRFFDGGSFSGGGLLPGGSFTRVSSGRRVEREARHDTIVLAAASSVHERCCEWSGFALAEHAAE
jgi:hypothetical protein